MKRKNTTARTVAGISAPPPRPTVLGAALVAATITFPIGVTLLVIDLLLF
ncbi:hypothetical protein [Yoonia sp. BS5-3]|uniref:Uncharacterized protein n=1 Tax=Yoonia phaeophyticola TaxID=3137369 RepID=A0ABZ2V2K1_9RHOB